jgi:signal transduction histidine kinase
LPNLAEPPIVRRPLARHSASQRFNIDGISSTQTQVRGPSIPLANVLISEELDRRTPRAADPGAENLALHALARTLNESPQAALDVLVEQALALCQLQERGTAGVSLLERLPSGDERFRWTALAGVLAAGLGQTTPRGFSPCGVCLDHDAPVLFARPDLHFTYFLASGVPFMEGLIIPFRVGGRSAGTIWIITHDDQRHFDGEDVRVMTSLAAFTGAAYAVLASNEAVEAASRSRTEFLGILSHDLRTPLTAIGGYASLIESGVHGPVTDKQATALSRIHAAQAQIVSLLDDLLVFVRDDAGRVEYALERVTLEEVLTEVAQTVSLMARDAGLSIELRAHAAAGDAIADREKLRQVLLNLVTNAIKFTPRGGRIELEAAATDDRAEILVTDTGAGIPRERWDDVFKPFTSFAESVSGSTGSGLGLAICRKLARGMGGDVWLERSEPGQGSTFKVTLPAAGRSSA